MQATPILTRNDLVQHLESGCKPPSAWRIGTEHEKFVYRPSTGQPVPYEGDLGVSALLHRLCARQWTPVLEGSNIIALSHNNASITLEPACQFELSGAPLANIHETAIELQRHIRDLELASEGLGMAFCAWGFHPHWELAECARVPKARYAIMRDYLPTKGTRGLDMMHRTCTIQVNLDFSSEADMLQKMRVGLALQPFATALFANSPIHNGQLSTYQSLRALTWTDTDNERCGSLPMMFEKNAGFERYVDYALDVPMFFVYRDGHYISAAGQSFRDFMNGKLPALPKQYPTKADWENHLTTLFPEVRLKQFLEMRGADGGPQEMVPALGAFWVGLLYHQASLDAATDLIQGWDAQMIQNLRMSSARDGLHGHVGELQFMEFSKTLLQLAENGLRARAVRDVKGRDETRFLAPLHEMIDKGTSRADLSIAAFRKGGIDAIGRMTEEYRYQSARETL